MPFETVIDYSAFSLRVPEAQVWPPPARPADRPSTWRLPHVAASTWQIEQLDATLRAVPHARRAAMRAAIRRVWLRFSYTRPLLDEREIARDARITASSERAADVDDDRSVRRLREVVDGGAADALDTIMMALYGRLLERRRSAAMPSSRRLRLHRAADDAGGAALLTEAV